MLSCGWLWQVSVQPAREYDRGCQVAVLALLVWKRVAWKLKKIKENVIRKIIKNFLLFFSFFESPVVRCGTNSFVFFERQHLSFSDQNAFSNGSHKPWHLPEFSTLSSRRLVGNMGGSFLALFFSNSFSTSATQRKTIGHIFKYTIQSGNCKRHILHDCLFLSPSLILEFWNIVSSASWISLKVGLSVGSHRQPGGQKFTQHNKLDQALKHSKHLHKDAKAL